MNEHGVENKRVTVLGAARSGIAAARLLSARGARVFVSDRDQRENKTEEIHILKGLGILFEFGVHSDRIYDADLAVISPGISPATALVQGIQGKGIPIFSELEAASWFYRGPLIGITGSNGKTTTTTLAGLMMRQFYPDTIMAGNIGTPFSGEVLNHPDAPCAVVEISSFQLETIDSFRPKIAVILNLAPNHLDWYKTYEDYIQAKLRILMNMTPEDTLIYNGDDADLTARVSTCRANKLRFSRSDTAADAYIRETDLYCRKIRLLPLQDIKLRGMHNYTNALAAALAVHLMGLPPDHIIQVLTTFTGIEHRLEFVADINRIHFINDSKATTLESLAVALTSFDSPIVLIAGGKDKGGDFSRVRDLIRQHVRQVILIGTAREKIARQWEGLVPLTSAADLGEAVGTAYRLARPGDTVLLSPACASFDMFKDFEDRGRQFKTEVLKLKEKSGDV